MPIAISTCLNCLRRFLVNCFKKDGIRFFNINTVYGAGVSVGIGVGVGTGVGVGNGVGVGLP